MMASEDLGPPAAKRVCGDGVRVLVTGGSGLVGRALREVVEGTPSLQFVHFAKAGNA